MKKWGIKKCFSRFNIIYRNAGFQLAVSRFIRNVFFPQLRMILDKRLHEPPAFGTINNDQLHTAISQIIFRPAKRAVLADYDPPDSVEQHSSAAHIAGR